MSSMDTALLFDETRSARASKDAALRLVLLRAEALSVPKRLRRLRVLTGTAWISMDGRDMIVPEGQTVELPCSRKAAVVSAVGCPAVVFEMR